MDDWQHAGASVLEVAWLKVVQACHFRGSKSRNKVSVGEPAEGSILTIILRYKRTRMLLKPRLEWCGWI